MVQTHRGLSLRSNTVPELCRTELDSHADTYVLGGKALITHDYERPFSVSDFDASEQPKVKTTVTGVVGYQDPSSGQTTYCVVNQAFYVPENQNNLRGISHAYERCQSE